MMNGYYYSAPIMNYVNYSIVLGVAIVAAAIAGIILFFTFFRRKNEDRFTGFKKKLYDYMNLHRFYTEDILRFVYIVATCVVTVTGIMTIILGNFLTGALELVVLNLVLRVVFELLMMFILLCRRTVSIDRKMSRVADYCDLKFDEFCSGDCGNCSEDCGNLDLFGEFDDFDEEADDEEALNVNCSGYCDSCGEDCSLRAAKINPEDFPF